MLETPSENEIKQAVDIISRLQKGLLPLELFHAVAAKTVTPTVDLVPVRRGKDGEPELLLVQRPADDPYWPNEWHVTGAMIRAFDKEGADFLDAKKRVLEGELHGTIRMINEPQYIGAKFWDVARGRELEHVFYFETDAKDEDVVEGKFFTENNLPELTISHHKILIPEIIAAFKNK